MYLLYTLTYTCVSNDVHNELHMFITIHCCCMCSLVYVLYVCMCVRRSTIVLRQHWGFPLPLPHMCTTWTPGYPSGVAGSRHLRYTNIQTLCIRTCIILSTRLYFFIFSTLRTSSFVHVQGSALLKQCQGKSSRESCNCTSRMRDFVDVTHSDCIERVRSYINSNIVYCVL